MYIIFSVCEPRNEKPINGVSAKDPTSNATAMIEVIHLWFRAFSRKERNQSAILPVSLCFEAVFSPYSFFLKKLCDIAGTMLTATASDASKANDIVSANGKNNSPTIPPTKTSGAKTAIVTSVDDKIGLNISIVADWINLRPDNFSSFKCMRR